MDKQILRTIDANFNRSREGLRVCEEITRFLLEDKNFTRNLKLLRHNIEGVVKGSNLKRKMLGSRDTSSDVGKKNLGSEFKRKDAKDVFEANLERSKEAVRALEEFFKLFDKTRARRFKEIRFKLYNLEKESVDKLETLRNIR